MKDNSSGGTAGGIGFCGVLAIVFIVLKLCKVISWSWHPFGSLQPSESQH